MQRTCVLAYDGSRGAAGIYAVPLTLEDLPAGTTNFGSASPFSAVGLQFLVIISSHYGSCNNVPVFTASTTNDGECSEVQIGSAYIAVIEVTLADFSKQYVNVLLITLIVYLAPQVDKTKQIHQHEAHSRRLYLTPGQ